MDALHNLCQLSTRKLTGTPLELGTRLGDTKDLQHAWTANLGVTHLAARIGLHEALPFEVGVVSGEWRESLSACPIQRECYHVVPNYTTPALYRTKEPVFLRGAASPSPYISLPPTPQVLSPELSTHDLESDESLRDRGLWVVGGAGQSEEFEDWVPCLKEPFEWEINGNANLAIFCYILRVTWCHCVRFSCHFRQNGGIVNVSKLEVLTSRRLPYIFGVFWSNLVRICGISHIDSQKIPTNPRWRISYEFRRNFTQICPHCTVSLSQSSQRLSLFEYVAKVFPTSVHVVQAQCCRRHPRAVSSPPSRSSPDRGGDLQLRGPRSGGCSGLGSIPGPRS